MTESLSSLFKKSDMSDLLMIRANSLQKTSNTLEKFEFFSYVLNRFPPFYAQEQIPPIALRSSTFFLKPTWDILNLIALYKRATVSDSLKSLF